MKTTEFIKKFKNSITIEGTELIFDFFISFSRFECALKASNEFANATDKKVEANWDKFANSIAETFNPTADDELKVAVDYILGEPPKIQAMINGVLGWRERVFNNSHSTTMRLCQHIRDMRNNLFHGGKFNGTYQPEISRNHKLLKSAITVLDNWLNLNSQVKSCFFESIPN
jgi:hypothetical protein